MKITRVTLENFMSHRQSTLDLMRPVNVVMGANGVGKSAIAEAIRFALLGTTRVTDARGAGAYDTIGPWGETSAVEIEIDGRGTIRREAAMDGTELTVSWAVGTKNVLQQAILDTIGGSADQVRAVLDASHVFHQPADAQQRLLQGLVDFSVTPGALLTALGAASHAAIAEDAEGAVGAGRRGVEEGFVKVAYVAGPYRSGDGERGRQRNIDAAASVAVELWRMGYAVICPHKNTAHFDGLAPDEVWLRGDLELILRSDLVVMLPGWEASVGASAERDFAIKNGVPVGFWPEVRKP